MNGTIRIHQTKALISGRKTLSPQDMDPMYILARDIDDRKTTAAMRLRLIRTYDIVQSRYSDRVRSRECVFHDEEGSYVHLNIPGNNVSAANSFIEGHVYCLKNFLHVEKVIPFCQYDLKEPAIVLIQMCRVKVPENTEELKAMQPKVPTKIPKEIVSLVGRGMLFKINVERDRLEKRNLAFPVMQIKDDIAVVNEYCPGMLKVTNQKSTNSYEQLDDDFDSDETLVGFGFNFSCLSLAEMNHLQLLILQQQAEKSVGSKLD
nr:putative transposase [Ipomoea batatas]